MPISADKRNEIRELLNKGEDNATVAAKTGVPLRAVAAIYSHIKMGTYSDTKPAQEPSAEVLLDSIETTFGLERDVQLALRPDSRCRTACLPK